MHVDEVHDFFSFPSYLVFFVSLSERVLCREFCFRQLGSGCVKGERRDADWELWETYTVGTKRGGASWCGAGERAAQFGEGTCKQSGLSVLSRFASPSCPILS